MYLRVINQEIESVLNLEISHEKRTIRMSRRMPNGAVGDNVLCPQCNQLMPRYIKSGKQGFVSKPYRKCKDCIDDTLHEAANKRVKLNPDYFIKLAEKARKAKRN